MDKHLVIASKVYDKLPKLVVISGVVDVTSPNKNLIKDYLAESWQSLRTEVLASGYKTQPLIAQWREALMKARIPVKAYPPSIEAIAKRAMTVTEPFSINSVVDAYNAISMDLILPLGAYDLDELSGNLQLRAAEKGEYFKAIGGSSHEATFDSELIYSDDSEVLTRQFLWRQSEKAKITNDTKRILFVCELLESMDGQLVETAEKLIKEKFEELFDAEVQNMVVDRRT